MYQNVIFDLDGTLLNTIDDLADAGNWVCEKNGWPTFSVEEFKMMVGNGIRPLIARFSPADAQSDEAIAGTLAQFSARYAAHKEDKTAPYDGILELLTRLRSNGVKCCVFSNKADSMCKPLMQKYFGESIYAVRGLVAGTPEKPDPAGLFALMESAGITAENTIFVGDSDVDMHTAQNGGLPAIGVLWGFRDRAVLEAAGATQLAATPSALGDMILGE